MTVTSVWSAYGHRFIGTDCDEHEACLTCGAMYVLRALDDNPTSGEYTTASGDVPADCTLATQMVHGYPGERVCDSCANDGDGCKHCRHDCNCLFCDS